MPTQQEAHRLVLHFEMILTVCWLLAQLSLSICINVVCSYAVEEVANPETVSSRHDDNFV